MSSKGRRLKETRGQYRRCKAKPCKRKAVRDGLCALHNAVGSIQDETAQESRPAKEPDDSYLDGINYWHMGGAPVSTSSPAMRQEGR